MGTTVIKHGTIVTADRTYKADVKIEHGKRILGGRKREELKRIKFPNTIIYFSFIIIEILNELKPFNV